MLLDLNWSSLIPGRLPVRCDFTWVTREVALDADRASQSAVSLAEVWRDLASGKTRVIDHFMTEDRCYVILVSAHLFGDHERPCQRKIDILESILLEGNPKAVAIDLSLAPSSVASLTKQSLASMGIVCTPSRVPPHVVMAVYASKGLAHGEQARFSQLDELGLTYSVVSVPRPDSWLSALLPPAEYEVIRLFVEGKTHAEIAASRRTTKRTVANQLASVFQRLGVSGRLRLLGELATRAAPLSQRH